MVNITKDIYKVTDTKISGFFGSHRFLSNFYPSDVWYEGILYPSVENAYQASKQQPSMRYTFVGISPSESKKLNIKLKLSKEDIYEFDKKKLDIMSYLVFSKFNNYELRKKLLDTESKFLEETNDWNDTYWGVCNGKGLNQLGHILMNVRKYYYRQNIFSKT